MGEFDLAYIQSPVTRLDHVVDLAAAVSSGFTLHIRIVVYDIVELDAEALDDGKTVPEHQVLELQAQNAIQVRKPTQRTTLNAPLVGLDVFQVEAAVVVT